MERRETTKGAETPRRRNFSLRAIKKPTGKNPQESLRACVNHGRLLLTLELLSVGLGRRSLHDSDRLLKDEVEYGFRGQLDLLAFRRGLNTAADASSGCRADGCSFATPCDRSDDATDGRARANLFSCILSAGTALFRVLVGLNVVRLAGGREAIDLHHDF